MSVSKAIDTVSRTSGALRDRPNGWDEHLFAGAFLWPEQCREYDRSIDKAVYDKYYRGKADQLAVTSESEN